jgi:hypothetical protein
MNIPTEQGAELSDVELLRRAVAYTRPCGFGVIEKWRAEFWRKATATN